VYRSFAVESGDVNPDVSYLTANCDGSLLNLPCCTANGLCAVPQRAYSLEGQPLLYLGINADQFCRALAEAWDRGRDEFGDRVTSIKP
ncbi:MAG: hypothetical protein ACKON9_10655, partial [Planctomycetaceae bacterium]